MKFLVFAAIVAVASAASVTIQGSRTFSGGPNSQVGADAGSITKIDYPLLKTSVDPISVWRMGVEPSILKVGVEKPLFKFADEPERILKMTLDRERILKMGVDSPVVKVLPETVNWMPSTWNTGLDTFTLNNMDMLYGKKVYII